MQATESSSPDALLAVFCQFYYFFFSRRPTCHRWMGKHVDPHQSCADGAHGQRHAWVVSHPSVVGILHAGSILHRHQEDANRIHVQTSQPSHSVVRASNHVDGAHR